MPSVPWRYAITPGSEASNGNQRMFGELLAEAMRRTRIADIGLAAKLGCSDSSIGKWRTGRTRPSLSTLHRLADILGEPRIVAVMLPLYARSCDGCGRRFRTDATRRPAGRGTFCSARCRQRISKRRRRERGVQAARVIRHQRDELRSAVDAFCRRCEPTGLCRDGACELRPVSPLPLIQLDRRSADAAA